MLFELREYHCKPGQREKLVKFMEEIVIPFQASKGVIIVGSFVGEKSDDLYIWIRRFESESERERIYKAVYESDFWKNEAHDKMGEMIDRTKTVVTRLNPTPTSVIR